MERLVIGLPESCAPDDVSVMRSYVDAVRRGGHIPVVLPATEDAEEVARQLDLIDVLLLLGGGDIASHRFGCEPLPTDGVANPLRDAYELLLFGQACERQMPVVGICRGLQIINVGLGGDLYQDLPSQYKDSEINHSRPDSKWVPVHAIRIDGESRLAEVLEECAVSVNSTHHQAIRSLGKGLKPVAYSEDGVVEAVEHQILPVAGVQFHPERLAWGEDVVFTRLFARIKRFAGAVKTVFLLCLFSCLCQANAQETMPADFVRVSEYAPDMMQEIRYFSTYNFVGRRIPGYEAPQAILTRVAADSLKAVNRELMSLGYRIKIMDAYRLVRAVQYFIQWAADASDDQMKPFFYPDCPKNELFKRGYLAHRSGHSRGSTVDVTLFDMAKGREVDMGSPYDLLGVPSHYAYVEGLTREHIALRKLLRTVMLKHGFKPVACEWWHFTLRDEPYPYTYFNFKVE